MGTYPFRREESPPAGHVRTTGEWLSSLASPGSPPLPICLGTAPFGTGIDRDAAFAVLDAFVEAGGTFLDTAHIYGAWAKGGEGASEKTIGEWLQARGARGEVVIGTKGAHPPLDDMGRGRCSKADLESDLSESLERLGVDSVDVYWLHRDEPARPVDEIIESLAGFVRDGRIRCYGASNWTVGRIDAANAYAKQHGLAPFTGSQIAGSLAERPGGGTAGGTLALDEPTRRWHAATGLPLAAYSSQAGGYFGAENVAWALGGFAGPPPGRKNYDSPSSRQRLLRAIALAEEKGCTPNQIALAYLLAQPFPTVPIIGTSNPEHVREAIAATSVVLTAAQRDALRG